MRVVDYHLYSRNGRFYYRCVLPKDLKPFIPFTEIKLSLSTEDLAQARLYVAKLDIEVKSFVSKIYDILESAPSLEGLEKVKTLVTGCLDELRQSVGLRNIRQSPYWYSSALEAVKRGKDNSCQSDLLSQISEEYLQECITNSSKTIKYKQTTYKIFMSIIGDLPLEQIKKADARRYKSLLVETPKNLLQKLNLKSYFDVDWNNLPDGKPQSFTTVNSRIIPLLSLFEWAERSELYIGSNPFKGLLIKEAKQYSNKRSIYTKNDLDILFSCPIYHGAKGKKMPCRLVEGENVYKDGVYWLPLIGLYSGMRLNEICQLVVSDIEKKENIWCFNVNDSDGKRLKTGASKRIIPIHSKIIELGFIDSIKGLKDGCIFHNLNEGDGSSFSHRFSRSYARLLIKLELKRQGLCFHSFRHTFIDALRNVNVERAIAMKLVGHGNSNDVHGAYGYGYNLSILKENIDKVEYGLHSLEVR